MATGGDDKDTKIKLATVGKGDLLGVGESNHGTNDVTNALDTNRFKVRDRAFFGVCFVGVHVGSREKPRLENRLLGEGIGLDDDDRDVLFDKCSGNVLPAHATTNDDTGFFSRSVGFAGHVTVNVAVILCARVMWAVLLI